MDEKEKNYNKLRDSAVRWGASLFGVADLSDTSSYPNFLDKGVTDGLIYGISMGVRLSGRTLMTITDHPTKLYFYHYRRLNIALDQLSIVITNEIQDMGYDALPIPSSQTIDWNNQKGDVSHKHIGVLAGLGWIGRNNLLVNPKFGSMVRYISVLTDLPLKTDKPIGFGCGSCRDCVDICPANAIKDSPEDFGHVVCYEKLREFTKRYHISHHICGVCVKGCKGGEHVR